MSIMTGGFDPEPSEGAAPSAKVPRSPGAVDGKPCAFRLWVLHAGRCSVGGLSGQHGQKGREQAPGRTLVLFRSKCRGMMPFRVPAIPVVLLSGTVVIRPRCTLSIHSTEYGPRDPSPRRQSANGGWLGNQARERGRVKKKLGKRNLPPNAPVIGGRTLCEARQAQACAHKTRAKACAQNTTRMGIVTNERATSNQ